MSPYIVLGKNFGVVVSDSQGKKLQMNYALEKVNFSQISALSEIVKSGVYIIGSALRLEPATLLDKSMSGGAYITDTAYRPLLAIDAQGVIRYLDSNIKWSVSSEGGNLIFTLKSNNNSELGKIVFRGDMITTWQSK